MVTHFTLVWLCSRVSELMAFEAGRLVEGLVALSALEGLLSTVDSHVLHQEFVLMK